MNMLGAKNIGILTIQKIQTFAIALKFHQTFKPFYFTKRNLDIFHLRFTSPIENVLSGSNPLDSADYVANVLSLMLPTSLHSKVLFGGQSSKQRHQIQRIVIVQLHQTFALEHQGQ